MYIFKRAYANTGKCSVSHHELHFFIYLFIFHFAQIVFLDLDFSLTFMCDGAACTPPPPHSINNRGQRPLNPAAHHFTPTVSLARPGLLPPGWSSLQSAYSLFKGGRAHKHNGQHSVGSGIAAQSVTSETSGGIFFFFFCINRALKACPGAGCISSDLPL